LPKLSFVPGIVTEKTALDVGLGFVDANLMRWRMQRAQPIGGWVTVGNGTAPGVPRALHEWSSLDGTIYLAIASQGQIVVLCADTFYNITPVGIYVGPVDASVATGFGIGFFGDGVFSGDQTQSTDLLNQIILQPATWSIDNFGEDLVFCPRGGALYEWNPSGGLGNIATLISANPLSDINVPLYANGLFVNPQTEILVAYGTPPLGGTIPDPMQIRWSDINSIYTWTPTQANSAGDYRLPVGSLIITALPTYYETMFWTDKGTYVMQFTGNEFVFSFQPTANSSSIISPNAAINVGSTIYWMDPGDFHFYNGNVNVLPCPLKYEVFSTINRLQQWKTFCGLNADFNEIWWFYPVGNEIDSYVTYNYVENTWNKGSLDRTCWIYTGRTSQPIACDSSGNVYLQETGLDADGEPMPFSLTTGFIEIEDGDYLAQVERLIPDFKFADNSPNGNNQKIYIDILVTNSPSVAPQVVKTVEVTPNSVNRGYLDMKVRGRMIQFRFYNGTNLTGNSYIMGKTAVFYKRNGRK
jgi:hypothetical protein